MATKNPLDFDPIDDGEKLLEQDQLMDLEHRYRLKDLKDIVSTDGGMRFFQDMMIACGVFSEQFKGNSQTYFDQGIRAVGLKYYNLMGEASKDLQAKLSPPYDKLPYQVREDDVKKVLISAKQASKGK